MRAQAVTLPPDLAAASKVLHPAAGIGWAQALLCHTSCCVLGCTSTCCWQQTGVSSALTTLATGCECCTSLVASAAQAARCQHVQPVSTCP